MLRVKTKLETSGKHGIGLFANEFIAKGTITWQYDPGFDTAFNEEILHEIPTCVREQFVKYGYYDYELKKYILCCDDQRFINHSSKNPNINSTPNVDTAAQDIQPGEELCCDYTGYERDWFERRKLKKEDFT